VVTFYARRAAHGLAIDKAAECDTTLKACLEYVRLITDALNGKNRGQEKVAAAIFGSPGGRYDGREL
jgi:hypothetical protein